MKRIILSILPLLLLWGCTATSQPYGILKGKITNEQNRPVPNATISLVRETADRAQTNSKGEYSFTQLDTGNYTIILSADGYPDSTIESVRLAPGKTTRLNIQLQGKALAHFTPPPPPPVPVMQEKESEALRSIKSVAADEVGYAAPAAASPVSNGAIAYDRSMQQRYMNPSTESYKKDPENDFRTVRSSPLSTLSVDVDRASYSNVRRFINEGQKPPADAVRVEEMINYFDYNYPQPTGSDPIAITTELTVCPWNLKHKLLHIGMQARKINTEKLPASNLVFLLDVSGSMDESNKLPLVKSALKLLVDNLRPVDKVSIVVYAGNAGLVLPPTSGNQKTKIIDALDRLSAGGSTAGGEGIELAYKTAEQYFVKGGNNRIILATDGDFNVGVSNDNELEALIVKKRQKGIFLTCLGFGMGNYKDSKMEVLADKGNGNYAYIDNIQEARKTLVSEFGGTLFTIAKDVKAQIEFNPAKVQGYRLVGYENRLLNAEDFKDDTKDAGEMGSGHSVTILYELIPTGVSSEELRNTDPLKYQQPVAVTGNSGELATVKFRYKNPDGQTSKEMVHLIKDNTLGILAASDNLRFSASVAMFGMLLKDSQYKGSAAYSQVVALAESARSSDKEGYRAEYIRLVKSVQQ